MTFNPSSIFLMIFLALNLALTGCGSTAKKTSTAASDPTLSDPNPNGQENEGLNFELNGDSDSTKAGGLRTIRFAFNSAQLSSSARAALENNAQVLKDNPSVEIQIEGHCDERGGVQYNLALGEQRAKTTKRYLKSLGISGRRVSTISFGKERPISFGHDEASWSQNRRANFVVTSK